MNIWFCCLFILDSMRCLIIFLNFLFNFPYFSSIVYIWFYWLCYFDNFPCSIFFHFICYVLLYEFYFFYYYCLLIYIFCVLILCSQFFLSFKLHYILSWILPADFFYFLDVILYFLWPFIIASLNYVFLWYPTYLCLCQFVPIFFVTTFGNYSVLLLFLYCCYKV